MDSTLETGQTIAPTANELAEAANAWGIQNSYWDMWGHQHHASAELLTSILGSLGVNARSRESLGQTLEARAWQGWHAPIGPTLVIVQRPSPAEITLSRSQTQARAEALLEIQFEQGGGDQIRIALGEMPMVEEVVLHGEPFVRKQVRLGSVLPLGYHGCRCLLANRPGPPPIHRLPGSRLPAALAGARPRRGIGHQFVRSPVGPQLGMRGRHGSESRRGLGSRAGRRQFHRTQSLARDSESSALQYQPLLTQLHSSIAIQFIWTSKRWRTFHCSESRGASGARNHAARNRQASSFHVRGIRACLPAETAFPETGISHLSGRGLEAKDSPCPDSRNTSSVRASCWKASLCTPRWKRRFTPSIRMFGTGDRGRNRIRIRNPPRLGNSLENRAARFCFTNICSGSWTFNSAPLTNTPCLAG